jgi:hypothetical protein
MAELIHEHSTHVRTPDGLTYLASVHAERQPEGTWAGWLEFTPVGHRAPWLRTERETTQPTRDAVAYWASGLEPVYLQGAFERAHVVTPVPARPSIGAA